MRKIRNPFTGREGYHCFGCSPGNLHGLQMNFVEEGDEIICSWDPQERFQGFRNVLHGGIQATMMDEIASWFIYVRLQRAGVTYKMDLRYVKPVFIDGGTLTIRSRLVGMRRNLADIGVKLFNREGVLSSEGTVTYFTFSLEKSKESFFYPEPGDFYEG